MDNRHEIVFIDTSLANWETLLASISDIYDVVLLNPQQNGLEQIATYLLAQTRQTSAIPNDSLQNVLQTEVITDTANLYDAIHILSHGSAGHLYLGSADLNGNNLTDYQSQLEQIGSALTDTGDLLLYGCNVAEGDVGKQFTNELAEATKADVAASTDVTGLDILGGNWTLEQITGFNETTSLSFVYDGLLMNTVSSDTLLFPSHTMGEWRNFGAFAAIKADGSVMTWGDSGSGGDSSAVTSQLNGTVDVVQVFSTGGAFAALRTDGSLVTWGTIYHGGIYENNFGGDSSAVASQLNGSVDVVQVFSSSGAFAALRVDGSLVTWGGSNRPNYGGDSSAVASQLDGSVDVVQVFSTGSAFAALRADGSVVTWGLSYYSGNGYYSGDYYNYGSDSSAVASQLDGSVDVVQVFSTSGAFAALRADGSVVTWGLSNYADNDYYNYGSDSSAVASQLDGSVDVVQVFSTSGAFAALRTDGSVVTWGLSIDSLNYGGDSSAVASQLDGSVDVVQVFSTEGAFAALRADGSVVTWGNSFSGGDSSAVASQLRSGVITLASIEDDSNIQFQTANAASGENWQGDGEPNIHIGTTYADVISSLAGNDILIGLAGDDDINGGADIDTAVYAASRSLYTITQTPSGLTVNDSTGVEGTDTLTNVERLQFADSSLAFDLDGNAGQTYRLYQAALNRTPDPVGLGGWISAMDSGMTLEQVATGFIGSAEFQGMYGANPTHAQFVSLLYGNVLHRAPDQAGFDAWVDLLATHVLTPEGVLIGFSESVENKNALLPAIQEGIVFTQFHQFTGSSAEDIIIGTSSADTLSGLAGNDILIGLAGNDSIDGGADIDTAVYSSNRSTYTIIPLFYVPENDPLFNFEIVDTSGVEGTDRLASIERLQFADTNLAFDWGGNAGEAYRLYQAALNRTPDSVGLGYWIHSMDDGMTLQQAATGFMGSAEFQNLYGANPSNGELINLLYSNVLHRAADQAGYDAWMQALDSGAISREGVLIGFSESTENKIALTGATENGIEYQAWL